MVGFKTCPESSPKTLSELCATVQQGKKTTHALLYGTNTCFPSEVDHHTSEILQLILASAIVQHL